ncbi:helix-turn-helix domain-containing protein [Actinomycetospora sp. TBRC 11914]|uniref:helix-turn-helix transcriptional regulator n=1 Tax=Actinomycetospora sp. TBRC 11914 TaxID=2729387 RepID=UPI00145D016E|nr:helix-turn-helix domain-containing protein [Actinomycetospora sp. TBRC 11914]NMO91029.1 helix-turn-helix domain-containing protein [Actinomycetospora sp. TBRC 11914]
MTRGDSTELAAALRQWRERLTPADVGLPAGPRRRTPGLRREEVARLAGVSVDYVVRLEQDRGPHPSSSVLGALARALRLTPAETGHLFDLAGVALPGRGRVNDVVRPSVLRLLDRMSDLPAMLVDARRSLLAWNPLADALMGDLSTIPRDRRNLLWMRFGPPMPDHPLVTDEHGDRERLDRAAVAGARAALARYPDDEVLRGTVDTLLRFSELFARLWAERPVDDRRVDRKSYDVRGIGRITLDCDQLAVPDDDQLLIVYSAAPGSPDAEKLDLLRVVGLQAV